MASHEEQKRRQRDSARLWRQQNPEESRRRAREYRKLHKDEVNCRRRNRNKGRVEEIRRARSLLYRNGGKERRQEILRKPHAKAVKMLGIAKHSAKKRGIEFDIRVEDIEQALRDGVCQVTGIAFDFGPCGPWRPSIDRIDPRKGYTRNNIQIVVWIYNTAKQQYCHEDVVKLSLAVLRTYKLGEAS